MRGIRKQSSDTQSSSQPKEKRRLDTKQKKGMLIGGGIFLVAVIALILYSGWIAWIASSST